ncbi:MAG TPA: dihydroorotate dehydrogenase electron transfer subunit [Candidatus Avidesulfovibrio excrementigallinarum]|nr:dihydroorotate dehydrogenase electron transfer subunit [Candidatus Avidesulfovibrio excrementigallinarum]
MSQSGVSEVSVVDNVPFGRSAGAPQFFALRLEKPGNPGWENWRPGQFVMLRPSSWGLDMPWGRPFSISRVSSRELVLFIQAVGRGTERIRDLRRGDLVRVWGPLGNGFAMDPKVPTLLLAGGMGVVPFVGYVERHPRPAELTMIFGHRMPEDCYPVETLGERIELEAYHETSPEDLEWFLRHIRSRITAYAASKGLVLACGPQPFLKAVQSYALECGARTQLSLEHRMGCGVGACLGCVCTTTDKWPVASKAGQPVQVCNHGPVFWADQIVLGD